MCAILNILRFHILTSISLAHLYVNSKYSVERESLQTNTNVSSVSEKKLSSVPAVTAHIKIESQSQVTSGNGNGSGSTGAAVGVGQKKAKRKFAFG